VQMHACTHVYVFREGDTHVYAHKFLLVFILSRVVKSLSYFSFNFTKNVLDFHYSLSLWHKNKSVILRTERQLLYITCTSFKNIPHFLIVSSNLEIST
jgi:hypothetical protein